MNKRNNRALRTTNYVFAETDSRLAPRISQSPIRHSQLLGLLFLLPLVLLSCGALWQTDAARAVEMARSGEYKDAAAALEPAVAGGNVDAAVVESLYYAWVRQGEYVKARDRFEAWAAAKPTAGPIRLAAGRIHHLTGSYAKALGHLEPVLNNTDVGVAASFEKAVVLGDTGKRDD